MYNSYLMLESTLPRVEHGPFVVRPVYLFIVWVFMIWYYNCLRRHCADQSFGLLIHLDNFFARCKTRNNHFEAKVRQLSSSAVKLEILMVYGIISINELGINTRICMPNYLNTSQLLCLWVLCPFPRRVYNGNLYAVFINAMFCHDT